MNQSYYGSICLTDLIEKAKQAHSSFTKAQNGKIYCNVTVWLNEEVDKYGNSMSIQANPHKDKKDKEERFYLGNCKKSEYKEPEPLTQKDKTFLESVDDGLPF